MLKNKYFTPLPSPETDLFSRPGKLAQNPSMQPENKHTPTLSPSCRQGKSKKKTENVVVSKGTLRVHQLEPVFSKTPMHQSTP
jgi:hypothetical protein